MSGPQEEENGIILDGELNNGENVANEINLKPDDKGVIITMEVDNFDTEKTELLSDMEMDVETKKNPLVENNLFENSCQASTSNLNKNFHQVKSTGAVKKGTINTSIKTMEFTQANDAFKLCQPVYSLKLIKHLELNPFIFNCPICFKDIKFGQGFLLRNCSHTVCVDCTLKYFQKNGGAGNLPCPLETDGCMQFMTKNEVNDLVLLLKPPAPPKATLKVTNTSEVTKKKSNKDQSFDELTELLEVDLIPNPEAFNCKICFEEIPPLKGVRLQECLHDFCRICLINTIKNSVDQTNILCPYADDDYKCGFDLQQREIKELLPTQDYYEYLRKTIETAEMNIKNSFHCKTPNCHYFWELEDRNFERPYAQCESCGKVNCFECEVIHYPQTCLEYKQGITENKTMRYVNDIVDTRKAMRCPKCKAVIEKSDGCDGMKCLYCKTNLCWATKGARWGPKGEGDKSGGCRCDLKNGRPCAPGCLNCH